MVYQHFAGYLALSVDGSAAEVEESKAKKDDSNSAAASSDLGVSQAWEVIDSSESSG